MKIKGLAAICKARKRIYIYEKWTGNICTQWIGDGRAMYPIYNLPYMIEPNVQTLFDIPEDKKPEYTVELKGLPDYLSDMFTDNFNEEKEVQKIYPQITIKTVPVIPMLTSTGIIFVKQQYLSALSDELEPLEYFERTIGSQTFIAIKTGFTIKALVASTLRLDKDFVENLESLAIQCRIKFIDEELAENEDAVLNNEEIILENQNENE